MHSVALFISGLLTAALSLFGLAPQQEISQVAIETPQQILRQLIAPVAPATGMLDRSASTTDPDTPTGYQAQKSTNSYGTIIATPTSAATWDFNISGSFSMQQDSYSIDFGDGSTANLVCESYASTEPVCFQFKRIAHTYAQGGPVTVTVVANTRSVGHNELHELLSIVIGIEHASQDLSASSTAVSSTAIHDAAATSSSALNSVDVRTADHAGASPLTVTRPSADQVVMNGSSLTIEWNVSGAPTDARAELWLEDENGNTLGYIGETTASAFLWNIPAPGSVCMHVFDAPTPVCSKSIQTGQHRILVKIFTYSDTPASGWGPTKDYLFSSESSAFLIR
jgi:hypothetical protein